MLVILEQSLIIQGCCFITKYINSWRKNRDGENMAKTKIAERLLSFFELC